MNTHPSILIGTLQLTLLQGDLTQQEADAIVNAANAGLQHGGGVAGAIVRRGGQSIQQESNDWVRANGRASHDHPAITGAGRLPCRYLIHAVGPIWGEGEEDRKLTAAVQSALTAADRLGLGSLAMPAISTGIYGFPVERAARVTLRAIADWARSNPPAALREISLVLYDAPTYRVFADALEKLDPA